MRRAGNGVVTAPGRTLKPQRHPRGYVTVSLSRDGRYVTRTVHSLIAETFLGPRPDGCEVNHRSGIKTDNELRNLEWMTPLENTHHAISIGARSEPSRR